MRWMLMVSMMLVSVVVMAHDNKPPKVITERVVVVEHDHDRTAVGALVGAGVTYWIMHYRANHPCRKHRKVCPAR